MFKFPIEIINHIYNFDLTYKEYFNEFIKEINIKFYKKKEEKIQRINIMYWNGDMPQSVYDWHINNS
mgnify:CR=1 FL=1